MNLNFSETKFGGMTFEEFRDKMMDCTSFVSELATFVDRNDVDKNDIDAMLLMTGLPKMILDTAFRSISRIMKSRVDEMSAEIQEKKPEVSIPITPSNTRS